MTTPQITPNPFPTPDRSNQSQQEFSTNAAGTLSWETNELAPKVNEAVAFVNEKSNVAQASAAISSANANYVGKWSELSGAYSEGVSVNHNDSNWILLSSTSQIESTEPSQSNNDWMQAPRPAAQIIKSSITEITGGKWVVRETPNGNYTVSYRLPVFTYDQVPGCPFTGVVDLFRRADGSIKPYHDIGVFMGSLKGNEIVSRAGESPHNTVNFDEFKALCANAGGKMMGRYEYAALMWMMLANDFQPRGNTEFGRSHEIIYEYGQRQDGLVPNDISGEARTLTGTGPNSWNHDNTSHGIADLVGNQWEWCDDFKLVDGQFFVAEYSGQPESSWLATGVFINSGGVLDNSLSNGARSNIKWSDITRSAGFVTNELLERLMIIPVSFTSSLKGQFYYDTSGERSPIISGTWYLKDIAGPALVSLNYSRSYRSNVVGGRINFGGQ